MSIGLRTFADQQHIAALILQGNRSPQTRPARANHHHIYRQTLRFHLYFLAFNLLAPFTITRSKAHV